MKKVKISMPEKKYRKLLRDGERLMIIKPLVQKVNRILSKIKKAV